MRRCPTPTSPCRRDPVIPDWARLALGTLTIVRVPAPRSTDGAGEPAEMSTSIARSTARGAMLAAPLVGLLLAVPAGLLVWGAGRSPLLASALVIALLALLTRGLHLDGLADTADGLGSGRPAAGALAIMRQSDIGPFGVATLVLTVLVQAAALAAVVDSDSPARAPLAVVVMLVVSRTVLPLACRVGIPAARPGGLGATVVGSVPTWAAVCLSALVVAASAAAGFWAGDHGAGALLPPLGWALAAALGLGAGLLVTRRCVRRLGGVTGDTLGAAVEVSMTVTLVVLALA